MGTSGLELVALGVGDAFSTVHDSTSLALGAGGRWLLVDCPHPMRKLLHAAASRCGLALDIGSFDAVVLTHLHGDHASGLETVAFYSWFVLGRRTRVAAHPAVSARLWEGHLAAGMERARVPGGEGVPATFEDYFELTALDDRRPVRLGPFAIECRRTRHPIPTTALRIEGGGRRLAYSADTEFDAGLVAWLAEADLVLHETGPGIHTPLERLAELPAALRQRMRLVHYPDDLDPATSPVAPLEAGQLIRV